MLKYLQMKLDSRIIGQLNTICAVKGITQPQALSLIVGNSIKILKPEITQFEANIKEFEARIKRFREAQSGGTRVYKRRKARKVKGK